MRMRGKSQIEETNSGLQFEDQRGLFSFSARFGLRKQKTVAFAATKELVRVMIREGP